METEIKTIHRKIDGLAMDMEKITRRLQSLDEFKEDVSLFTNDAFSSLIQFMGEVEGQFQIRDLLSLIQKALRNLRGLSSLLDQLQSFRELMEDASPLFKEMFSELVRLLDQMEKDGVLQNLAGAAQSLTRMISEFSPTEIERIVAGATRAGKAAAHLATEDNLAWLERAALAAANRDTPPGSRPSLFRIMRKARHPALRSQINNLLDIMIKASNEDTGKRR